MCSNNLSLYISLTFDGSQRDYIYDPFGQRTSTWLMPQNFGMEGRIYMDGRPLAYRAFNGTTYFTEQNLLGTERVRTDHAGGVVEAFQSLYYGDGYAPYNGSDPNGADQDSRGFAGMEHDGESNTEHATYRQYSPVNGRWMSPDPYSGSYDFSNPQSFNRYSYAANDPAALVDPSGLQSGCGIDCPSSGGGTGNAAFDFFASLFQAAFSSLFDFGGPSFQGNISDQATHRRLLSSQARDPNPNDLPANTPQSIPVPFDFAFRACIANCGRVLPTDPTSDRGEPSPCMIANLNAVNTTFKLHLTLLNNVITGTIYQGGLNVLFSVRGASMSQVPVGRYPLSNISRIIGVGRALHVPGPNSIEGIYDYQDGAFLFNTHIDTAYATWHTPIGAAIHGGVDVLDHGAFRSPC